MVQRFLEYLQSRGAQTFTARDLASWLAHLAGEGLNAGSVLAARTAINSAVQLGTGCTVEDPWLSRVVQGIQMSNRAQPRYSDMWDAGVAYAHYLREGPIQGEKVISALRARALMLLRLSFAARAADARHISRASLQFSSEGLTLRLFKWKTQGTRGPTLSPPVFVERLPDHQAAACAVATLEQYLQANERNYDGVTHDLIWTAYNSSKALAESTLLVICRKEMDSMGIDKAYGPASVRHAAITAWINAGITRDQAMRRTGHQAASTITKFYDRSARGEDFSARVASTAQGSITEIPAEDDTDATSILSESSSTYSERSSQDGCSIQ